jgi:hypothetical protein
MKLNELVRSLDTWTSNEERAVLQRIDGLQPVSMFDDREIQIIEGLIRKSLVVRVENKGNTFIYPNA